MSIIVPTYNRLQFLQEALASVDYPGRDDYEVIVVDDVSTDGTWGWLQDWQDGETRRAVRMESNSGPGAARNRGAEVARGQYLAFLDSDDRWFPYSLKALRAVIESGKAPAIILHGCVEVVDGCFQEPKNIEISIERFPDLLCGLARGGFFVGAAACVIERSIFLKVGGFTYKRMNAEDHDLMLKSACEGPFVLLKSPPIFAYRRHDESLVSNSELSFRGYRHLVSSERLGLFPGGRCRRSERLIVLTRILRPAVLAYFYERSYSRAFKLYRDSFGWNLRQWRLRFLFGAWLYAIGIRIGGS